MLARSKAIAHRSTAHVGAVRAVVGNGDGTGIDLQVVPLAAVAELRWCATAVHTLVPVERYAGSAIGVLEIGVVVVESCINDPHHHIGAVISLRKWSQPSVHFVHVRLHAHAITQQVVAIHAELEALDGIRFGKGLHIGHRHTCAGQLPHAHLHEAALLTHGIAHRSYGSVYEEVHHFIGGMRLRQEVSKLQIDLGLLSNERGGAERDRAKEGYALFHVLKVEGSMVRSWPRGPGYPRRNPRYRWNGRSGSNSA